MRSKFREVEIKKSTNIGHLPVFLSMMHRHLEKEQPAGQVSDFGTVDFSVPVDLFNLSVSDPAILDGVESIHLTYRGRK